MAVKLIIQPGVITPWNVFDSDAFPEFSIGCDGAVSGQSRANDAGTKLVLDHHLGDEPFEKLVRALNKLLQPRGWTDEMREATRDLIKFGDAAEGIIKLTDKFVPSLLKGTRTYASLAKTVKALNTLSPLMAVLASDPSTRSRFMQDDDHMFRMSTRSACGQALFLLNMGLYEFFQVNGEPTAHIVLNHGDEDSCVCSYAFLNPDAAHNRIFRGLVSVEDQIDASGGLYPCDRHEKEVRQICWMTEPISTARKSGRLFSLNKAELETLILTVHERITAVIKGGRGELPPETDYEIISKHDGWVVVKEIGAQARLGLAMDNINAFLSVKDETPGAHRFTGARRSPFIAKWPCPKIVDHLNRAEGIRPENPDRWGGALTIFGSPLIKGSKLSTAEVTREIEYCLAH